MKKVEISFLIIAVLLLLIVVLSIVLLSGRKPITETPIQVFSPSPTQPAARPVSPSIPPQLQAEKVSQENYAKNREEFIRSKPWVLKLPLKSDNYFVSYNPEIDTVVVELYYIENINTGKNQQVADAKQAAENAMIYAGIDTNTQKIKYLEVLKKQ